MGSFKLISIHAPRVGSDFILLQSNLPSAISIHAPRVGSDVVAVPVSVPVLRFQSTLPVWGATDNGGNILLDSGISIHAPRVGSD